MKRYFWLVVPVILAFGFILVFARAAAQDGAPQSSAALQPQTTISQAFTYQGFLNKGTQAVNGTCAISIAAWDSLTAGTLLNSNTFDSVPVVNGLFTVQLDYGGNLFTGQALWLETSVKCSGDASFMTLSPRLPLTAAPYASYASNAFSAKTASNALYATAAAYAENNWGLKGNSGTGSSNFLGTLDNTTLNLGANGQVGLRIQPGVDSPNMIGGYSGNIISSTISGGTIAGGGMYLYENKVTNVFGTIGGGLSNWVNGYAAVIAGGNSNTARVNYSTVGGGVSNRVIGYGGTIAGGQYNDASGRSTTVGGGIYNIAAGNGSTVGGGGWNGSTTSGNYALGTASTIAGGFGNLINADGAYGVIGGGNNNKETIGGATISGGTHNTATNYDTTIGGGVYNTASGTSATVAGGEGNITSGYGAIVPGGSNNLSQGNFSFAAGNRAKSLNNGCFTWADSNTFDFTCSLDNAFTARATGGVYFVTAIDGAGNAAAGVQLPPGGSGWDVLSDRSSKTNLAAVNGDLLLEKLAQIPIETWSYKTQDASIRHIGPMAQDFAAAFGVGEDNKHINTVDADGVSLAAIQALYHLNQDKDAQIASLQQEVAALQRRLDGLDPAGSAKEGLPFDLSTIFSLAALAGVALLWLRGQKKQDG